MDNGKLIHVIVLERWRYQLGVSGRPEAAHYWQAGGVWLGVHECAGQVAQD